MTKEANIIPNHVAIIPDGNRRWAKEKGLNPWEGHEAGAANTEKLIHFALEKGIGCLTVWGSSMDNLIKRPLLEKKALVDVYTKYFEKLLNDPKIYKNEVRINIIGRWESHLPESLKKILKECIAKTENYNKKFLNFMLAYEGEDEMIQAIQNIIDDCGKGVKITADLVKKNLMTKELPPVDYMVRTGGEPHLSAGFMMWDMADAQLYFSSEKYPDFNEEKFEEALEDYAKRQRRFGK